MSTPPMRRPSSSPPPPPWHPTFAHLRAVVVAILLTAIGVVFRRPDALVLASPFLVIGVWSVLTRPVAPPATTERLAHDTLREGESTAWIVEVETVAGMEDTVAVIAPPDWIDVQPRSAIVTACVDGDRTTLRFSLRTLRWGTRAVGPTVISSTSSWGAFRWHHAMDSPPRPLTVLPMPTVFDTSAPVAHANGLVGQNRSARPGDGSEFNTIRPFQVGDRLRRIHWPTSLRSGSLHVTSTFADLDSNVILVVDAVNDVGISEGIDGRASSLDVTVRAAGAIAEHHLQRGDRVGLNVFGAAHVVRVPPASGSRHLRRILDTLSTIDPGTEWREGEPVMRTLTAGSVVIMLTPMVARAALERAIMAARHGLSVIVVDTLPAHVVESAEDDPLAELAWRVRLLERRREIRLVQEAGVPVIAWRGPGTLDQVLRDLSRRASAPRMVRR